MLIKHKFKNPHINYFNVGYDKIKETLIYLNSGNIRDKIIIITDLNFSLDDMLYLYKMTKEKNLKVIYIDHHDYNKKQKLVLEKLSVLKSCKVIHDTNYCATKLTYKYLKLDDKKIRNYTNVVNAYDIWLKNSKLFKIGVDLNNYFWDIRPKRYMYEMHNFDLTNKYFINSVKPLRKRIKTHFNKLEENNLSFVDNGIRLVFTDDYIGMVNLIYKERATIIASSYNKVSVRLDESFTEDESIDIKNKIVNASSKNPYFIDGGGHPHAFGLTYSDKITDNFDLIIDIVKGVFSSLDEVLKEY